MKYLSLLFFLVFSQSPAFSDVSVSPSLFFMQQEQLKGLNKITQDKILRLVAVTLNFPKPPDTALIGQLESHGVIFKRDNGVILHSTHIYPASIYLDSLSSITRFSEIEKIENSFRPSESSTLNVSNPQVQASEVWYSVPGVSILDGSGVTIADIDTGIDIYHPGFFKPDAGTFQWIDANRSGYFESGIDYVDLNSNGSPDTGEILRFYDSSFSDPLHLMDRTDGVYDADIDWLYNDVNNNGAREYGPASGFTETDPSFGERIFIIQDINHNNRLDPGELLIGLGTSKIAAIYDKNGKHFRGQNLLTSTGDLINHGTGACGIASGQVPGRRLTGMAPGADIVMVNRLEVDIAEGTLWAKSIGANIFFYEYGSWVFEPLDGSSNIETMISDLFKTGYHQFKAAGNLAGPNRKKHSSFTLPAVGLDSLVFNVPDVNIKEVYISLLWRGINPKPAITLSTSNSSPLALTGDLNKYSLGNKTVISGFEYSTRGTSRMDVLITSTVKITGSFTILFKNSYKSDIFIHGYISDNVTSWVDGTQFSNYVTDNGTVCAPGTALDGITVGAYDPRGTRNIKGDINDFSSWGLTVDGRRGVDLTAPGDIVYSLNSHYVNGNSPGGYIDFGGTSGALPHVAGCAALLMQAMQGITPPDLKNALQNFALHDNFTGQVPNYVWGYGKLRIYNAFLGLNLVSVSNETFNPSAFTVSEGYPNPFNSSINFSITTFKSSPVHISIYDILGQRIRKTILKDHLGLAMYSWDGKNEEGVSVSSGLYYVDFSFSGQSNIKKIIYMK
jgi:subtilisin family serine protease